jgi:hypothetical protein
MYIRYFLGVYLGLCSLFLPAALYFQALTGRLTRIGYLSENNFGWNGSRSAQQILKSPPDEDIHVVVVGDSFSNPNIWQSRLHAKTGFNVASMNCNNVQVNPKCFLKDIKNRYPKVKVLVLQTVERFSVNRMISLAESKQEQCLSTAQFANGIVRTEPGVTSRDRRIFGPITDIIYLFRTFLNEFRLNSKDSFITNGVYVSNLERKDLFTSKRSDKLLYVRDDVKLKEGWSEKTVSRAFQAFSHFSKSTRDHSIHPVLFVIPDKLSAYSPYLIKNKSTTIPRPIFWQRLIENGNHINPLSKLSGYVHREKDIYEPNDSHLSPRGYQLIADALADYLSKNGTFKKESNIDN